MSTTVACAQVKEAEFEIDTAWKITQTNIKLLVAYVSRVIYHYTYCSIGTLYKSWPCRASRRRHSIRHLQAYITGLARGQIRIEIKRLRCIDWSGTTRHHLHLVDDAIGGAHSDKNKIVLKWNRNIFY